VSFVPRSPASAPAADARVTPIRGLTVALVVAASAFLLYRATLLPDVDFGDSGSIQTIAGTPLLTPRNGYPLYFGIGALALKPIGGTPAHAMNLLSAIEAAAACGLLVGAGAALTGSLSAAAGAAVLFAVSYTFWSQSVTAEVYALHLCFVIGSLLLLLRWEASPTRRRLAAFFCCFAVGFGNHLSMLLLLPAFTAFLFAAAPNGWRSLLGPGVVLLAIGFAALGASPYLWNFHTLWFQPDPPASLLAAVRTFWFDVTKSDWRDTMVLNVPQTMIRDHAAMYWFDLRQQFGTIGIAVAVGGAAVMTAAEWRRAVLLLLVFVANAAFAFGYNVGDSHVFYLPAHVIAALFIGYAVAWVGTVSRRWSKVAAAALLFYAVARGYRDFPALDRSSDFRAAGILGGLTRDVDDGRNILLVDLNWQIANGLSYVTKVTRPQVAAARMRDVLLYAPALIRDNLAHGRDVVLTAQAAQILNGSYGPLFEPRLESMPSTLDSAAATIPPGSRFVLCVLKPTRDFQIDAADLRAALSRLGVSATSVDLRDYVAIAGLAGAPPLLIQSADRPFTASVDLDGVRTQIRMESWLSADTIRRMGFGHVIARHRHTLIVERGISFVAFDENGVPTTTRYFAGIFAELPRFILQH
jgi:transmembrane protein TMEM260 (protein O-mannosyltransferase)